MSSPKFAGVLLAAIGFAVLPCLASPITPDGSWYNFWNLSGNGLATNGTSCLSGPQNGCVEPYFAPGDPPWTFTVPIGMVGSFVITDGGHQGDIFSVFNFGNLIGTTSTVTTDTNHNCGNFPTPCLADPAMSHGTFALGSGDYSVTIREDNFFEPSSVAWFNVTLAPAATNPPGVGPPTAAGVPEPATCFLVGSALLAAGLLRRRIA